MSEFLMKLANGAITVFWSPFEWCAPVALLVYGVAYYLYLKETEGKDFDPVTAMIYFVGAVMVAAAAAYVASLLIGLIATVAPGGVGLLETFSKNPLIFSISALIALFLLTLWSFVVRFRRGAGTIRERLRTAFGALRMSMLTITGLSALFIAFFVTKVGAAIITVFGTGAPATPAVAAKDVHGANYGFQVCGSGAGSARTSGWTCSKTASSVEA